jgi:D-sedoheptulose 7-phosphate isomerase
VTDVSDQALDEHVQLAGRTMELRPQLDALCELLIDVYRADGTLYTFGNGGSAADAQHLAGELLGRFKRERRPLAATALSVDPSVVTCIGNDYAFDDLFARQVVGLARPNDLVLGFTTSGSSENVVRGLAAARDQGAATAVLTGAGEDGAGGPAAAVCDVALVVPSTSTARVQEMHLLLLHLLIDRVDAWAAGER